jgi:hypothetical protein
MPNSESSKAGSCMDRPFEPYNFSVSVRSRSSGKVNSRRPLLRIVPEASWFDPRLRALRQDSQFTVLYSRPNQIHTRTLTHQPNAGFSCQLLFVIFPGRLAVFIPTVGGGSAGPNFHSHEEDKYNINRIN